MNTSNSTFWTPYKIPATPTITNNDVYHLSCTTGSNEEKNPSQFLQWIKGGSGDGCVGLNIYVKTVKNENDVFADQVWIGAGTVADIIPSGIDPINGKLIATSGSGRAWARVTINGENGEIESAIVDSGTIPVNTETSRTIILGSYQFSGNTAQVSNFACGSVYANICRNWFAIASPFYTISLFRSPN